MIYLHCLQKQKFGFWSVLEITSIKDSEAVLKPSLSTCYQPVPIAAKPSVSSMTSNVAVVRPGTATNNQGAVHFTKCYSIMEMYC